MMHRFIELSFIQAAKEIGIDVPSINFERPKIADHGHLSTNIAMTLAKQLRKKPQDIAQDILAHLNVDSTIIDKVEIAGAGFINIYLNPHAFHLAMMEMIGMGSSYGSSQIGSGKTANIEYVSANPTGNLHLGHGRNAAIGDTVSNLLEWTGYTVTREYYFNNAGNQMNMLAKSIFARYQHLIGNTEYPFPEDGYHGEYIIEIAEKAFKQHGNTLSDENSETLSILRKMGEEWCFASIMNTLKKMNIHQDTFFNEDSLFTDGSIDSLLGELKEKELSYEKDGATWMKFSEIDDSLTDRVIVKSTGEPTYRLPDIAYHRTKFERNYDLIVDIFGADHIATIPDVKAGIRALGYDVSKLKVLIYQFVTLWDNGEQVKMSKRSGKSYTLDELIDEVGADVVRFFFLMRGAQTQLEFDLQIAREQNDKNPVYYLQYVHARICSLLRQIEEQQLQIQDTFDASLLIHSSELNLISILTRFEEVTIRAAHNLEPQMISEYLREVASAFHSFYHDCRILGMESSLMNARIHLAILTKTVMSNGLTILGISSPTSM
jgi:arginyl-tRNA synthetase